MKKKAFNIVMTGALTLGVLGAASLPALAASNTALESETKAKAESIMENLRTNLAKIGVQVPEKQSMFEGLDEKTKIKAEAIWEKKKAGTITESEAQTQLKALGVTLPERGGKGVGHLADDVENANLDKNKKAKAEAILAKVEKGTITHDEAEKQLEALGVTVEERGGKDKFLAGLDEETKARAKAILEKKKAGTLTEAETAEQLKKLGITLPERPDPFADLDEETKAKAESIMEKLKAGTITHDEAHTQLKELGVELPGRDRKGGHGRGGDMLQGLDEKTKAEAESLIEDAQDQLKEIGVEKMPGLKMK